MPTALRGRRGTGSRARLIPMACQYWGEQQWDGWHWVQCGQSPPGGESPGRYGLKSKQRSLTTRLVPQNGARYTSSSLGAAIREPAGERGGRRSGFHRDTRVSKAGKAKASISQMCHLGIGTSWLDRKEENILRGAQAPGFNRGSRGSGCE